MRASTIALLLIVAALGGCKKEEPPAPPPAEPQAAEQAVKKETAEEPEAEGAEALIARAKPIFGQHPDVAENPENPITPEKVTLGRQLYYEKRLSKNHDISCNSCHDLSAYGIDVREKGGKTSKGHKGAMGDRNSPTVYNAALHIAQFWDGRAADVEAQAKGPVLNPVEMAMPDEGRVVETLKSIPGYEPLFKAAFPDDADPITYDNMAKAIGAFERKLMTKAPVDEFLGGDTDALNAQQQKGLALFLDAGCVACHAGPNFGGQMYQKLGLIKPYETEDLGRFKVTEKEADKYFFKVPSLRNVAKTGPYLHDGSIATLEDMVQIMAQHQTAKGKLSDEEVTALVSFLNALTGQLPTDYIKEPAALESGPKTPKPDPS
ncbi:MAG: cytochrome-c peroxidase [Myxococcales bacterium]|jgi:cytochrome c peroxidase